MQATEQTIRTVIQEVLAQLGKSPYVPTAGKNRQGAWGVFPTVDQAVDAANEGFRALQKASIADRIKAIDCVRKITNEQAEELGLLEMEETKIGRLDHKIEKLKIVRLVPGVEFLKTDCLSGDNGVTLIEHAPFGVIGAITPVTHSLPTLAGNVVSMVAGGNTLVVNAHPGGARIAAEGVRRFNKAIFEATGLENIVTIIEQPTLETAAEIFNHKGIRLLCVTGGPAVARAALESRKRAVVAGPGNPPVVVDESACLENAAKSIVKGAAYDNNLLCIAEKQVFAVESIFDGLLSQVARHGGYKLNSREVDQLSAIAFKKADDGHWILNRDLIGRDASVLAGLIGVNVPASTQILFGETDKSNPYVSQEQMMPFVPFVRVKDVTEAIRLAKDSEHNYRHTSLIHSRNIRNITTMGREMDTTLFIQNGACMSGLGLGGEGYLSYSIATPTGEGVTSPLTFTRQRRSTLVGDLHIL